VTKDCRSLLGGLGMVYLTIFHKQGNILGANQPFRANYGNFNLGHRINIQGKGHRRVGGGICKKCDYPIQERVQIRKLPNPPYPLDVDPMTQIEVSIVCTERLVCT